ncbi:hypothetical protein SAMN04487914_13443 [Arthrobacter sp. ok909]|nr:hypothetical protein SAMN04487914_13443 [Arthrobacter sp. ok909]
MDGLYDVGRQLLQAVGGRSVGCHFDQNFIIRAAHPAGFTAGNHITTGKRQPYDAPAPKTEIWLAEKPGVSSNQSLAARASAAAAAASIRAR